MDDIGSNHTADSMDNNGMAGGDNTSAFAIVVTATAFVMLADGTIIFIIIKERLWRDDNALLILNLMFSFVLSGLWQILSLASDSFHWDFGIALLLGFQVLPHTSALLTLVSLAFDRFNALKKKTLVKIYSRSYAARRLICIWVVAGVLAMATFVGAYIKIDGPANMGKDQFFTIFIICHFSLFALAMMMIIVAFLMVWKIHRHNVDLAISKGTVKDPAWQKTNKASGRLTLTVAGLVLGQFATWLPIYIYVLSSNHVDLLEFEHKPIFIFLLFANFFIAPVMIFLFSALFRRYFKRQLLCCLYPDLVDQNSCIDDSLRSSGRRTISIEEGNVSPGINVTDFRDTI